MDEGENKSTHKKTCSLNGCVIDRRRRVSRPFHEKGINSSRSWEGFISVTDKTRLSALPKRRPSNVTDLARGSCIFNSLLISFS